MRTNPIVSLFAGIAMTTIATLAPISTSALAHSWYDEDCCGGNDCEQIAIKNVTFPGDGTIHMTDAKRVVHIIKLSDLKANDRVQYPKNWDDEKAVLDAYRRDREMDETPGPYRRASLDGEYHLCLHVGQVRCVYLPADR